MSIKTEIMIITPKLAGDMLLLNTDNRKTSPNTIAIYADKMRRGLWKLTHQGIAFDENGVLLDGQTRLAAVIQSGCTVEMQVSSGVPRDTFASLDTQRARSAGQLLHVPNSFQIVAALRVLICLDRGRRLSSRGTIQSEDVMQAYANADGIEKAVSLALSVRKNSSVNPSMHAAVLYCALQTVYASQIDSWIFGLREGINLSENSPIRRVMMRFSRQTSTQIGNDESVFILIVKAWNAHAQGLSIGALKTTVNEAVPQVVGLRAYPDMLG